MEFLRHVVTYFASDVVQELINPTTAFNIFDTVDVFIYPISPISSGGIFTQVKSVLFSIASSDRVAGKSSVAGTLAFVPTSPIPIGGTITLNYPSGFFALSVTPAVAAGASSVVNLKTVCSSTSDTSLVITTSGVAIDTVAFTMIISGFVIGISGAHDYNGISIQTSTDIVSSPVIICPKGSYVSIMSSAACTFCPAGTYSDILNANACVQCPSGKFCAGTGLLAASGDCQAMSFSVSGATDALCTSCAEGHISPPGSSACQRQEHPVIVFTMSGSVDSFSEGSSLRRTFVSGLAVLLKIPEWRIVIVSVRSGSIIIELGFLRDVTSSISPSEITSRLNDAAAAGQLEGFGTTGLSIGGQFVSLSSSSSVGLSPGIIIGITFAFSGLVSAAYARVLVISRRLKPFKAVGWIVASLIFGPLVWLLWVIRNKNKVGSELSEFRIIKPNELNETNPADNRVTSGSFATVRKCTWQGIDVAVKQLFNYTDSIMFEKESRMMHRIWHPNCVRMYGVCVLPRQSIVMEWMGGGDLLQFILQRPIAPLHRRMSLFRQICAGLNGLHSSQPNPIIHSDLKPANILLDKAQKIAKIADFGLSKVKASSASFTAGGSLLYLAPEVLLHGSSANQKTDVFAMGLIFWEILAGKTVWCNEQGIELNPGQLIAEYNKQGRPAIDDIPEKINPDIVALMQSCWAEDPTQRPTAEDLWRRVSELDMNNPESNQPLIAFQDSWLSQPCSFEDCLQKSLPQSTYQLLLGDFPRIDAKYREAPVQEVVQNHHLSELEAKCIIVYTLVWKVNVCPRHEQLYFLFCQAYRLRDVVALERFADFSFHFWNGLRKLPKQSVKLYRGLDRRLMDICDLYEVNNVIHWHYPSSATTDMAVASKFSNGGTLISFEEVSDACSIQVFSLEPSEKELLLPYTCMFVVEIALSCERARLLRAFGSLPDNVDLVVLRAKHNWPS